MDLNVTNIVKIYYFFQLQYSKYTNKLTNIKIFRDNDDYLLIKRTCELKRKNLKWWFNDSDASYNTIGTSLIKGLYTSIFIFWKFSLINRFFWCKIEHRV